MKLGQINIKDYHNIYLVGIGGIGMSALSRYFKLNGWNVAGHDRVKSRLTHQLQKEGIDINFEDKTASIPKRYKKSEKTLIVYTTAIPEDHKQLTYFRDLNFSIRKRSEMLGIIALGKKTIAVAGTHGKTSVSTLIAHILYNTQQKCTAFLGGISKNYQSNLLFGDSDTIILEADEYDRSFLHLFPDIAVVTSLDADHLDIYRSKNEMVKSYRQFVNQIKKGGLLICKRNLPLKIANGKQLSYTLDEQADCRILNLRRGKKFYIFDFQTPDHTIQKLKFPLMGKINLENMVAAVAVALQVGVDEKSIRESLISYQGVERRFDMQILQEKLVYIDDYAHHPKELEATISSVKELFPQKKITAVFQPHLYSRTQDFAHDFAKSLNLLDKVILLPIYPARELPIKNVTSQIIFEKIVIPKKMCEKKELFAIIKKMRLEVIISFGAGDIGQEVEKIKETLLTKC